MIDIPGCSERTNFKSLYSLHNNGLLLKCFLAGIKTYARG